MRSDNIGPLMMRSNTDLPFMNDVLMAHRATNLVYRKGPARKVHLVVPSASPPSPQSAVIRTVRPTRPSLHTAYGRRESTDIQRKVRLNYEGDRPRDRNLSATDFYKRVSKDAHCGNDDGKDVAPAALRIHRGFCAAAFEDSEDEEGSFCDDSDIQDLDLKATTHWANCNWQTTQKPRLTNIQLRILENVLRDIVAQALAARRNGRLKSSVFSEEATMEDTVLETILELMELGQSMKDARAFQGEEGGDIQMMVRNNFHTLMRKATRPFRPSGIKIVKAELSSCLEAFRQLRLRLLWENQGMSMAEILDERSLDIRPR